MVRRPINTKTAKLDVERRKRCQLTSSCDNAGIRTALEHSLRLALPLISILA